MPGPYRRVPQELKEKILDAVQNDGIPVSQASREYGVSTPSIHSWLKKELESTSGERVDMREVNRLRKDKDDLLKLVGALTAELDKTKQKYKGFIYLIPTMDTEEYLTSGTAIRKRRKGLCRSIVS